MVRRFIQGIEINSDTLARELIEKVGPGGNFLQEEHTYQYFRKEHWIPTLMARQAYDAWEREGRKTMGDRVREKIRHILETHSVPPLSDAVLAELARLKKEGEKQLTHHTD